MVFRLSLVGKTRRPIGMSYLQGKLMTGRIHGSVQLVYTPEWSTVHGEDASPYPHYHLQKVPPTSNHLLQTESPRPPSFPLSQVRTL
jgi:hypothetical protein